MNKKIMICGASGTGKTTLAKHISEEYGIPYIDTSAKNIWPKFGFENHKDAHTKSTLNKELGMKYQFTILKERGKLLRGSSFVTDRSFIDNATYMMMGLGHMLSDCDVESFFNECMRGMLSCDLLLFIRWGKDIELKDDKNRIINTYYQAMVDRVMEWVVFSNDITMTCPVGEIKVWDFETRKKLVKGWLEL